MLRTPEVPRMPIVSSVATGAVLLVIAGTCAFAATAQTPPAGCLTAEQLAHNARVYALDRRTSIDDSMPIFDPQYFVGAWDYAWDGPDSPLGPGGSWKGVVTFRHISGCAYEGELIGEDGDGKAFLRLIKFSFDAAKKHMTWIEEDTHGYTVVKSGPVGGELGGVFQHHWEDSPAFKVGNEVVKLKGTTLMPSPAMHRYDMHIAVGDGPSMRFGTATFRKQLPDGPPPAARTR